MKKKNFLDEFPSLDGSQPSETSTNYSEFIPLPESKKPSQSIKEYKKEKYGGGKQSYRDKKKNFSNYPPEEERKYDNPPKPQIEKKEKDREEYNPPKKADNYDNYGEKSDKNPSKKKEEYDDYKPKSDDYYKPKYGGGGYQKKTNYDEYEKKNTHDDYEGGGYEEKGNYDDYGGGYEKKSNYEKKGNYDNYGGGYEKKNTSYAKKPYYDNKEPFYVLMVAEKPSIAASLSEALAYQGNYKSRKGISNLPVYEFEGEFLGTYANIIVTSVAGHVFNRDFPEQYANWKSVEPQKLFDVDTVRNEANPKGRVVAHLAKESKGIDFLVLWLDNDREGENICFEVMDVVEPNMKRPPVGFSKNIFRAHFSSLAKQDLKAAYEDLKDGPNLNESLSVDARQIIDLKVGVVFSRFQTMYFTKKYQNLGDKLISFGPCQTPTLGFCVQRTFDINNFVPKAYYKICVNVSKEKDDKIIFSLDWEKERTYNLNEAETIKAELSKIRDCKVNFLEISEGFKAKPEGLNTVNMLKVASSALGMGPQHTMSIAERLYLGGLITYPRTESTSYPGKFEFKPIINSLTDANPEISAYANKLLKNGHEKPRAGVDVGDHPPITPTANSPRNISGDEIRLYNFIARHFLASISPDARFLKTNGLVNIGSQDFSFKGVVSKSQGFTEIMDSHKVSENYLPKIEKGDQLKILNVEVKKLFTTPPDYLTESELIALMEKHGIGTDASMAVHINNISEREYVKIVGSRRLMPTNLGLSLIKGYNDIDKDLSAPELRSGIEKSVSLIAKGQKKFDEVIFDTINIFKKKFENFLNSITKMDMYFQVNYTVEETVKTLSKCNKGHFMKYEKSNNKLTCDTCNIELNLPENTTSIKLLGEKTCPIDKFQLVCYSIMVQINRDKSEKISFMVCPKCFTNNPINDIELPLNEKGLVCSECPNEGCEFSASSNKIRKCENCEGGKLILGPHLPPVLTASCNVCENTYVLKDVASYSRLPKKCEKCQAKMLRIKQLNKPKDTPELEVCIFCAPELQENLLHKDLTIEDNFFPRRRGRGSRRRGGGKRGSKRGSKFKKKY